MPTRAPLKIVHYNELDSNFVEAFSANMGQKPVVWQTQEGGDGPSTGSRIMSGAATGASIGTMIAPGIGTAIGLIGGGLFGALFGGGDKSKTVNHSYGAPEMYRQLGSHYGASGAGNYQGMMPVGASNAFSDLMMALTNRRRAAQISASIPTGRNSWEATFPTGWKPGQPMNVARGTGVENPFPQG